MAIYPAYFEPRAEGGYMVEFPDLPGCLTEGKNESEAMAMARDALDGHILALRDLKREVPPPSLPSNLQPPEGSFMALVDVEDEAGEPVRINASINSVLLARIDDVAKREGLTRSGLLSAAARHYMASL